MFTKMHYEALAKALVQSRPQNENGEARQVWAETIANMCELFITNNPRFSRQLFINKIMEG